jgi:hypothetical protein
MHDNDPATAMNCLSGAGLRKIVCSWLVETGWSVETKHLETLKPISALSRKLETQASY